MNLQPLLFEMIASRAGTDGNSAAAGLFSQLCSASGADDSPTIQELLAQIGNSNPTANLIAKYLTDQQAKERSSGEASVTEVEPELVREASQDSKFSERELLEFPETSQAFLELSELRQDAETMLAELKQLRERNEALAFALGACCCFGEDQGCRTCRGRGRPGFCIPDRESFAHYVLPAVRMLQVQKPNGKEFSASTRLASRKTE
jgi:hypothetical protein